MSDSSETPQTKLKMDHKVFNDPIHGTVELHPLLIKIIDTPQFQRLRNIKQLGGAYFVYPGASHNRFEHSIGVAHLAGQLVEALRTRQPELDIDERDVLCVKIAGLCHDLGHGPFSHLYDQMFIPKVQPENEKHEDNSVKMFDHLVESNNKKLELEMKNKENGLTDDDLNFIKKLIEGLKDPTEVQWSEIGRKKDKFFLFEIVANKSNGIDVDKFDYFARDCYHLGMKNNFDHLRFIQFARVIKVEKDGLNHICSRDKEVGNLYDMFYTRNCLHRRAYQHKVNKIIEYMIAEEKINGWKEELDQARKNVCPEGHEFEPVLNPFNQWRLRHEMYHHWEEELAAAVPEGGDGGVTLTAEDFVVLDTTFDYGMKDKDPINNVYFYNKINHDKAFNITKDQVSKLLPACFSEQLIRVYSKKTDDQSVEAARNHLVKWCEDKGLPKPQLRPCVKRARESLARTQRVCCGAVSLCPGKDWSD
ncbi:deoxynucleoside triphosphate triphosphohydrolase SAMHD1 [Perca flavescens]|uniref:deoxynucleoside triphosphate triphosphohydrolase SAMHD1 n=1 Tax=Perca flavescens TaxID=8167 RepID=UPI00106EF6E5|nr:deoxynucleoside triphosphate triphosphohydrolase SAMHD1-like [Perca flavescens]